jgi:hypothetical protein
MCQGEFRSAEGTRSGFICGDTFTEVDVEARYAVLGRPGSKASA